MRRCVYGEGGFITIFGNNGQCNVYQLVQFNHIHRKPVVKRSKSAETPLPPLSVNVVNDFTESGRRKNKGLAKADPVNHYNMKTLNEKNPQVLSPVVIAQRLAQSEKDIATRIQKEEEAAALAATICEDRRLAQIVKTEKRKAKVLDKKEQRLAAALPCIDPTKPTMHVWLGDALAGVKTSNAQVAADSLPPSKSYADVVSAKAKKVLTASSKAFVPNALSAPAAALSTSLSTSSRSVVPPNVEMLSPDLGPALRFLRDEFGIVNQFIRNDVSLL